MQGATAEDKEGTAAEEDGTAAEAADQEEAMMRIEADGFERRCSGAEAEGRRRCSKGQRRRTIITC